MKAKLRVLRGKLRTRQGDNAGLEISIRGPRFLVGSSTECKLCCQSAAISPEHCELNPTRDALWVNDLDSQTGTFVNDVRTVGKTRLAEGDRLRVGRLEFEVVMMPQQASPPPRRDPAEERDPMSEFVSDLLGEADAEERARRMADPSIRQFDSSLGESESPPAETGNSPQTVARPMRQPPKKLPPPPEIVADDSVQAAEETLKQILARLKGPKR